MAPDLALLQQISERFTDGLWLTTGDLRRVLYVSPGVERIWGISTEVLLRQPHAGYEAVHEEDQVGLAAALATVRQQDVEVRFRVRHAAGAIKWVRTRAFAVNEGRRRTRRIAGIVEDVTARQHVSELYRSLQEQLAGAGRSLAALRVLLQVDEVSRGTESDGIAVPSARMLDLLAANEALSGRFAMLSAREREVAMHMLAGVPTKRIAATLTLSPKTIDQHRSAVLRKTGATSAAELARRVMGLE